LYRITEAEANKQRNIYKKNYNPWKPYSLTQTAKQKIGNFFADLITTQNGQDTDDYCVTDNNKVERYLSKLPRGKLLLLGVGTGREILIAKELGFDTVGITLGSRNIDFGKQYLGLKENEFFECILEALPFKKETFDIIAGFQVFEHALSPLLFLMEQGRILKEKGLLILEWPPANEQFSAGENPHHQICYTPGQAKALYEKAGFENIDLLFDDMSSIPSTDYWKGEQTKMLLIKGNKSNSQQSYIKKCWEK
jgi:SAM-dependent methyltransferase